MTTMPFNKGDRVVVDFKYKHRRRGTIIDFNEQGDGSARIFLVRLDPKKAPKAVKRTSDEWVNERDLCLVDLIDRIGELEAGK